MLIFPQPMIKQKKELISTYHNSLKSSSSTNQIFSFTVCEYNWTNKDVVYFLIRIENESKPVF